MSRSRGYGYVFCTPRCTPVAQTLVARGPGAVSILVDAVKYVKASQRTGKLGRSVQTTKLVSTELCIGRQPVKYFQRMLPIHGNPSVTIGCNPRWFIEALETVETGSCLCRQNSQGAKPRDPLTLPSSGKRHVLQLCVEAFHFWSPLFFALFCASSSGFSGFFLNRFSFPFFFRLRLICRALYVHRVLLWL